jgi:hypothetical protein
MACRRFLAQSSIRHFHHQNRHSSAILSKYTTTTFNIDPQLPVTFSATIGLLGKFSAMSADVAIT